VSASSTLTLQPDTASPVGQAVAITYASRMQEPGRIAIAVTGFNIQNVVSANISGITGIGGWLKYDDTVLEIERNAEGLAVGDFVQQGDTPTYCCLWQNIDVPNGVYPFFVSRAGNGRNTVQGSGEILLARFHPRAGVTSATTRIELAPFDVDPALGGASYVTTLLLSPYGRRNMIDNTYGATVTIRPGS
jgi:hypothetical protein